MKKFICLLTIVLPFAVASCGGGSAEEIVARFGSERSELAGNPAAVRTTCIHYEDNAAGDTLWVDYSTYDNDGNILTYEIRYPDDSSEDYRQSYLYDNDGNLESSDYVAEDYASRTLYTRKGGLITRAQIHVGEEKSNYYKFTYKGDRETSRSLFNNMGLKLSQTDRTWDGDRVVKEITREDEQTTIRIIEYPDDFTEIITVEYEGYDDKYTAVITFDDKGNFSSIRSEDDGEVSVRHYSYDYDSTGNWTKRTVTDEDGSLLYIDTRTITYR